MCVSFFIIINFSSLQRDFDECLALHKVRHLISLMVKY